MIEPKQAEDLCREYAAALFRLRRHRRAMRETKCEALSDEPPCWLDWKDGSMEAEEMCGNCLLRQVAYHFRKEALKEVARLRRAIERWAKVNA